MSSSSYEERLQLIRSNAGFREIKEEEADDLLENQNPGTYLIIPSQIPHVFAIKYVNNDRDLKTSWMRADHFAETFYWTEANPLTSRTALSSGGISFQTINEVIIRALSDIPPAEIRALQSPPELKEQKETKEGPAAAYASAGREKTEAEKEREKKIITEIRSHAKFKPYNLKEAKEEIEKAPGGTWFIVQGEREDEFQIFTKLNLEGAQLALEPPYTCGKKVIKISNTMFKQVPVSKIIPMLKIDSEGKLARKNMEFYELILHENYKTTDEKDTLEKLNNATKEEFVFVFNKKNPEQPFELFYGLPPLPVVRKTFDVMTKDKFNELIASVRGEQHALLRIEELQKNPNFNPDLSLKKALHALDITYSDKLIIIRNKDNTFECCFRMPPLTFHKTYDPKKENFDDFLDLHSKQFRNELNRKRNERLEEQKAKDEKMIAENRESSMRQLSGSQVGILGAVRAKYGKQMDEMGGLEAVLKKFKDYLEKKSNEYFLEHLKFLEGRFKEIKELQNQLEEIRGKEGGESKKYKEIKEKLEIILKMKKDFTLAEDSVFADLLDSKKLPLEYNSEFNSCIPPGYIKALYFTNPYHTALRYFLKPNPLIKRTAKYAAKAVDPRTGEEYATHADIASTSLYDLGLLWLAATDTSIKCIKGFTNDTMMEFFAQAVGLIARGHNWDTIDAIKDGPEKQKLTAEQVLKWGHIVDDLGPDDPSCMAGVNQRLIESIMGNPISELPESRPLDPAIVRVKYAETLATKFYDYLDNLLRLQEKPEMDKKAQLEAKIFYMKQMQDWFDRKYVMFEELLPEQQKVFDDFRISPLEMRDALKEMKRMYGDRFEWTDMRTDEQHFSSYAHYFASLNEGDPWQKAAVERLVEQMRMRTENLEKELLNLEPLKEHKKEKEVKILHAFERKSERKDESPKGPKPQSPKSSI